MAGRDAFVTSLYINVLFGLFFFLAFCLLRTRLEVIYSPRVRLLKGSPHCPSALPRGLFAWIKPLIQLEETKLTASAGLDATMYLRFLYLSFQLFSAASIFGCCAVLPVNIYYDNLYYAESDDGTIYMANRAAVSCESSILSENISCTVVGPPPGTRLPISAPRSAHYPPLPHKFPG